ncbi:MAG: dephospho-CoA kinase [Lactobacillaceae bacterium]|jgi:dephospho-CoA kinase|nr:dephospho-CoA kinase [Lactobacillaceae bacterium]
MRLVAITGSIGTGKTTLAKIVRDLGYNVYDIDAWVRRLYYRKEFIVKIGKIFPEVIVKNKVNKRVLRNIVFNDNKELKKLEALIHPFLDKELKNIINKTSRTDYVNFIDVALLFEMGWDKYVDLIIVTDVPYEIQKNRVVKRDNVTVEHFEQINKVQMNSEKKKELADVVINTDNELNLLKLALIDIIDSI